MGKHTDASNVNESMLHGIEPPLLDFTKILKEEKTLEKENRLNLIEKNLLSGMNHNQRFAIIVKYQRSMLIS